MALSPASAPPWLSQSNSQAYRRLISSDRDSAPGVKSNISDIEYIQIQYIQFEYIQIHCVEDLCAEVTLKCIRSKNLVRFNMLYLKRMTKRIKM